MEPLKTFANPREYRIWVDSLKSGRRQSESPEGARM